MEGKKSFVLYSDIIHTVKKLPNNKAGELFKLILSYVNDENPTTKDLAVDLVFEPIKQQLKRDLKEWERIRGKRSEAGKASANKRQQVSTSVESVQQKEQVSTVNETVTVSVNVNDSVKRDSLPENSIMLFNVEEMFTKNQIEFERICMLGAKNLAEGAEILHKYHLFLEERDQYPKSKKALRSGFEKWILNEKTFNNGHTTNQSSGKHKGALQLVTSIKQDIAGRAKNA
jgi:hypothetical protein